MERAEFDKTHSVRTDGQIHLEPINIDGLTDDELTLAVDHPAIHVEVRSYARALKRARKQRLEGRIATAAAFEKNADKAYKNRIPARLRW